MQINKCDTITLIRRKKNHTIILKDTGKAFGKIQLSFTINTQKKLGGEGTYTTK